MQIIGFCRFSFFGPSDTKIAYTDTDHAFRRLYDPARMEVRFRLFENLLLPSIAAQTDPDFRLIVLSSAVMPAPYRDRLEALCAPHPQIEPVFAKSQGIRKELVRYTGDPQVAGGGLMQFRIDDDDALSCNFVARLRQWADVMRDEMILTLPRGLMLFEADNKFQLRPMYRNLTGAGYAFRTDGPTRRTVFSFAHLKSGRRFPYVSDPTLYSFIQSFTPSSDTAFRAGRKIRQFLENADIRDDAAAAQQVEKALTEDFPAFCQADLLRLLAQSGEGAPAYDSKAP